MNVTATTNYYNATGLTPDTRHTIGTRTVDASDNINMSWVNHTARSAPLDTTPPVTVANLTGSISNNGWYISNVQVSLMATDNEGGSGVNKTEYSFDGANWSTYTVPLTVTNEGTTSVYYSSTDNAGNVESAKNRSISIDKTPPQVTINKPANGSEYILNQTLIASWSAYDLLSGVASATGTASNGSTIDTDTVGAKVFSVTATDYAGNNVTQTASYTIAYNFLGIQPPIRSDGSSIFKLGSTIPVKFRVADANGNYVSTVVSNLTHQKITDEIFGRIEESISTSAANDGNTFRYDITDNLYIFNLGTSGMATGTYQLSINLDDGTVKIVRISIKQ
ncbi:MAG: PxKF domain-containing protein [Euryarchaeota archaeon]|nr:PxKF domain-containing protein [Euryarchaeota archaeon]MBU4220066.1 PxKF domain-containing protein [Euryarchaeota archaeon]MCG2736849.1 PxKF domain-containing protein [Candidatus Methanoperedenaceae archaeon]